MKKIINLHVHSHYSGLDSIITPKEIVDKTKEQGVFSVAITDHGNMNNWGTFNKYANSQSVKPILGCEFYKINDAKKWKEDYDLFKACELEKEIKDEMRKALNKRNHLIILVKNEIGFENINYLIYESYKNFYYKPRIDKELLIKYHKGLICSSACMAGEIQQCLINGEYEKAEENALFFKELFKEDFYFEIQFNEIQDQIICNYKMIELAKKLKIKVIITADSHYLNDGDEKTHQTLLLLQTKKTYEQLDKKDAWEFSATGLYLKDYNDFYLSCKKYNPDISDKQFDEFCENTFEIDSKVKKLDINTSIKLKDVNPNIKDKSKYLYDLCMEKLLKKNLDERYVERLKEEIEVIKSKNLENYFLIVSKIVNDARKKMMIGASRGCFLPSMMITGKKSYFKIKNAKLYERFRNKPKYVLTHDTSYQKILNKFEYDVKNENCVRLFLDNNKKIECTDDHKIFVKDFGWKTAKELTLNDILQSPVRNKRKVKIKANCKECNKIFNTDLENILRKTLLKASGEYICSHCAKSIHGKNNINIINTLKNNAIRQGDDTEKGKIYRKKMSDKIKYLMNSTNLREKISIGVKNAISMNPFYNKHMSDIIKRRYRENKEWVEKVTCPKKYIHGDFYSNKMKKYIKYASSYELKYLNILENDHNVIEFEKPHLCLSYYYKNKEHYYFPDLKIKYKNGSIEIHEVKPKKFLLDEIVILKKNAAENYCTEKKYKYKFITEDELFIMNDLIHEDVKILKIENFKYTGKVYDIEVENSHNYVVSGVSVHNSGGGSLINYLLEITQIDPIKYGLLFSRFLSVARSDYPDIDIDFENNDQVKSDLIEEFGLDTACVSSYNTFQYAGLLRDLARTYGIESPDYFRKKFTDVVKTEIEQNIGGLNEGDEENEISLTNYDDLIKYSKTFKLYMETYPQIVNDTKKLLGKIKHIGKHAAGVIICDNLIKSQSVMVVDNKIQTSLSEGGQERLLSDYGFVKIDILGLSTLSVLNNCLKLIAEKQGKDHSKMYDELIHPDKIDLFDKNVFEKIFNKFNLYGIFQFETDSMKVMINKTRPDSFKDLIAINALFRPGPLSSGIAFEYGDRKRDKRGLNHYNNDIVKEILEETYGIIVFQEQVMLLGNKLGKFSMEETNSLRKLLMKTKLTELKDNPKLIEAENTFKKGAKENGMKNEDIDRIWKDMVNFSRYSFNKAHSVGYAMIAYQCAFLKTYYPLEFYCTLLQNEESDNYRKIINEAKKSGIEVLPFDINISEKTFCIKNGKIYFGFININNCGEKGTEALMNSRKNKKYENFIEFMLRDDISWRHANKRIVEALIKIGAFDFGVDQRNLLLKVYEEFNLKRAKLSKKQELWTKSERTRIINEIYETEKAKLNVLKTSEMEKMAWELEYYKFNLMYSPFEIGNRKQKIDKILASGQGGSINEEATFYVVMFNSVKKFNDKRGKEMCFLELVDHTGRNKQGIIFSSNYKSEKVVQGEVYVVKGKNEEKLLIDKYENIENF